MNNGDILIDINSINDYVKDYDIIPSLREIVRQAQDENPGASALGLRPINIERTIDALQHLGITTIEALDKELEQHKEEICRVFNQYDRGAIAAKHVYTPIYIFLETV